MSNHDTDHDTKNATTIRASKGGGGGKLLLGAVAAAVLVGGGYFVWKNYAGQDSAQTAYNDTYSSSDQYGDEPLRASPIEPSDDTTADTASTDAAPAASSERSTAPSRRSAARSQPVPEATIGITPASVTTEETAAADADDLVVTAPPRPIWVRTPSERRLSALYPARALERGREGEARLQCTVLSDGSLDCARVEETPGGFGNAAMRVARTLRHAPTRADGTDAAGTPVNLRVVFRIDEDERGQQYASR